MASLFNPSGKRSKKQKRLPPLPWPTWQQLCAEESALQGLLSKGYKPQDILEQYIAGFQPGGVFSSNGTAARQQAVGFVKRHGVALCQGIPVDAVRKLYEVVGEQAARPAEDGALGSSRMQMVALDALTTLLIGLRVHETDPRLLKVHVQRLYRELDPRTPVPPPGGGERSGPSVQFAPDLHHRVAASDCLRAIEMAFPGMLLSGGGRLLELSLAEATSATPAATQLALTVLAHGAARYVEQQQVAAAAAQRALVAQPPAAPLAPFGAAAGRSSSSRLSSLRTESLSDRDCSGCTSPLAASLIATTDGYSSSDGHEGALPRPASPSHPHGRHHPNTPDGHSKAEAAMHRFIPSSPVAVAGPGHHALSAATSTSDSSTGAAAAAAAAAPAAGGAGAGGAAAAGTAAATGPGGPSGGGLERVPEKGGQEVHLVSKALTGLRHFYVPEYYQGPEPPGLDGCTVVLPLESKLRLQEGVPHFLRLLPRVVPEDLHQTAALLAPLLRAADCQPQALQPQLERHLRSSSLPLLQAVLMLLDGNPSIYQPWQDALIDQLFRILVGRSASPDQRCAVLSWLLRRHHQQRHAGEPSLFGPSWSAVLPAPHDDVLLLTLKVKAMAACVAAGIGEPWQMLEGLSAWEGFWAPNPKQQELRAAAYVLRLLCTAEVHPSRACGSEHLLRAMVVAVVVQMAATRPQFLPAVESFMQHSAPAVRSATLAAFSALLAAAFPPPAPLGILGQGPLQLGGAGLRRRHSGSAASSIGEPSSSSSSSRSSAHHSGARSADGGAARHEPSEHSAQHSSGAAARSAPGGSSCSCSEGSGSGWEDDSVATQGANSDARVVSRGTSAVTSPEGPPTRTRSGLSRRSSRSLGYPQGDEEEEEGQVDTPAQQAQQTQQAGHEQPGPEGEEQEEGGGAATPRTSKTEGAAASPARRHRHHHHHHHGQHGQHHHHHHHHDHHHKRSSQQQGQQEAGGARSEGAHSAPAPSGLAAAAGAGEAAGAAEPAAPPPTLHRPILTRKSAPIATPPKRQQGGSRGAGGEAATLTMQDHEGHGSQPLSARLSSSLPSLFSRRRAAPATPTAAQQAQQQAEHAGHEQHPRGGAPAGEEQGRQGGGQVDRATRAVLARSASFSALAAAAGWIKAQHWLMDPENAMLGPPPQPPDSITRWEEAQAWLSQPNTWAALSVCLLRHDAMRYRVLLLEIVQTPALCPLGALSFLEHYARRYVGELPGDALPPQTVGSAILAICQACVMTHLFDPVAQQQPAADSGSGAWGEAQGAVAQAVQRVLGALSTSFPVAQTRHKAGAFLQHLSAATSASLLPTAGGGPTGGGPAVGGGEGHGGWQLVRQLLGDYFAEALSGSPGLSSSSPLG